MNLFAKGLVLCVCLSIVNCLLEDTFKTKHDSKSEGKNKTVNANEFKKDLSILINKLRKFNQPEAHLKLAENEAKVNRTKRQLGFGGGFGVGFGAYDYNDYYGDYLADFAYDYYDWVCSDNLCKLCNILGGECCDPDFDVNCFLPDSCINNPCLNGGTCITTKTIDNRPDFVCSCNSGLTGKYCQLTNDYFVPFMPMPVPMPLPVPPPIPGGIPPPPPPPIPGPGGYGGAGYPPTPGGGAPFLPTGNGPAFPPRFGGSGYQGGYGSAPLPQQGGYGSAPLPQQDGYGSGPLPQQGGYGSGPLPQQGGYGGLSPYPGSLRSLSAKKSKCPPGQAFSADKGECIDFALSRNRKDNGKRRKKQPSEAD